MFDTFQRYLFPVQYIQEKKAAISLLEVGPNGPGIFRCFRSSHITLTTLDIIAPTEEEKNAYPEICFTTYNEKKMPFPKNAFEVVLCIDVLEHIPENNRETFLRELLRVSKKTIFLSFPVSTSRIPEKILQTIFLNKFSFLQEHESYGLPKLSEIHSFVEQHSDWKVIETRGTINRWAWIPIKLLSSIIHRLYKGKEAQKLFQFYGRTLGKVLSFGTSYSYTILLEKK